MMGKASTPRPLAIRILFGFLRLIATAFTVLLAVIGAPSRVFAPLLPPDVPPQPHNHDYRP